MTMKPLSPQELRVWHAFRLMHEDVLSRVGRDITQATGLSGSEFGVLSRLAGPGKGEMRQQVLAGMLAWDKSRLSHQLTRMHERSLIERRRVDGKTVLIALPNSVEKGWRQPGRCMRPPFDGICFRVSRSNRSTPSSG